MPKLKAFLFLTFWCISFFSRFPTTYAQLLFTITQHHKWSSISDGIRVFDASQDALNPQDRDLPSTLGADDDQPANESEVAHFNLVICIWSQSTQTCRKCGPSTPSANKMLRIFKWVQLFIIAQCMQTFPPPSSAAATTTAMMSISIRLSIPTTKNQQNVLMLQ